MKVTFRAYNILFEFDKDNIKEMEEVSLDVENNTTLNDVPIGIFDLSEYYNLSSPFAFNVLELPYIIKKRNGIEYVCWNVSYREATINDFIYTHNIKENIIVAKTGYPQAGGPGFLDFQQIWQSIYPVIEQFVNICGFVGIVAGAGKWIHSLLNKKDVPPQSYFDLIFSREHWNHIDLAQLLEIDNEKSKLLLKLFGYEYNHSKMMFSQQPISLDLKEKLSKINVSDIS